MDFKYPHPAFSPFTILTVLPQDLNVQTTRSVQVLGSAKHCPQGIGEYFTFSTNSVNKLHRADILQKVKVPQTVNKSPHFMER